ncbi:DUF6115 domain-containing protein [Anaeroselena agilis]|uniref:Uncharacterized protein n=1 Tax=Anaeroselena agilis TaxID=3063788 RepID=A0ABU3NYI0_9FIRM|nr:hypothetical protein [Selenomonadales bacterium 4137-cl]
MLTGTMVFVVIILFFVFFIVYKRGMIARMFTLNAASSAGEFQQELERTADAAIRRLETQIGHLEYLLDEADARIAELDKRLAASRPADEPASPAASPAQEPAASVDVRLAAEPPPSQAAPIEEQPARETPGADRRKLILSMAEQGYSVTEIAKMTGAGKGEIILLLQLNKK